ncbi:MAG: hypothetical protein GF333_06770 [Candidatus Omnitrophica bacterium]|nr:hypothetical protein [Candidatus Omnitrophota bacterium]
MSEGAQGMDDKYARRLEEIGEQLGEVSRNAEDLYRRSRPVLQRFLSQWYEDTSAAYVKNDTRHTSSLKSAQLEEMRDEVSRLILAADKIVEGILSAPEVWEPFSFESGAREHKPGALKEAVRKALGRLAPILDRYGYLNTPQEKGYWSECNAIGRGLRSECPYMVNFPRQVEQSFDEYRELTREAVLLHRKKLRVRQAQEKQKIEDMWESGLPE